MEQEMALLQARVDKLERQVEFLMRINGLDVSALRSVPNSRLLRYYQDAVHMIGLSTRRIPPESIERWAEFFLQISEYEMVRLQGIVDHNHTWEPFYNLVIKQMTAVRQHKNFGSDFGLQQLYAVLERGRKNVRDVAVVMCRRHPEDLPSRARILLKDGELEVG